MNCWLSLAWFAVLSGSFLFQLPDALGQELEYRVGVGRVDVTPSYPVRLNGFGGRREEADGVSQHLWAKAIAVSRHDDLPVVLFTLDNLGIREPMVRQVADVLREKYQIPRENVILTFTHTHCGPKVNGASDTIFSTAIPPEHQKNIDRYTSELPGLLVEAACQAIDSRRPASLAWSIGKVGFAANRRTAGGPVDHDLPVLVARDEGGATIAIYTSYACHCVTLSFNQYSGDWAGYAQEIIEKTLPGATALVSIGCGSDSNPTSGVTGDNLAAAADQGQQIANEVSRLVSEPMKPISGPIAAVLNHIELPLNELPTREQLVATSAQGGSVGFNAQWQLDRLAKGEPLVSALDYPIQTLTFGSDLQMVFLAGEVCVDYALRLKRELNRDRVWIHGYSNDFCAYIPSERLLKEGGYGGGGEIPYFALPTTLATGLEEKIISAVKSQTPEEFHTPPGTQGIPPKSPAESLSCMKPKPDFVVELIAAEPLISDPVAIDFGLDFDLWVAEMPDYGRGVAEEFQGQGRIKRLFDDDNNGTFDRGIVFCEGLRFPTDVKIWRDGVLICDAPDVIFAADRDGDGRAEIREVVITGFATHNPHARVNSLRFGIDGWVYGSGGLFGGQIANRAGQVVDVSNRDFRFDPDTGLVEAASGQTQQGRACDEFENWFGCTNSELLLHYPVDDRYTSRISFLAPPEPKVSVPSQQHGQQLYPPNDLVLFKLSGAPGRPTSACGIEFYRDVLFGADYRGDVFICEPVNQLVHRMKLKRNGATFVGDRASDEMQSEFLTSTDKWFRPVQSRTGPDGALYVVDMYRYVIEHSQWIPPETQAELNIFAGQGMGRIYRLRPTDSTLTDVPKWRTLSDLELVEHLASSNGPRRDIAHQCLIWNGKIGGPAIARLRDVLNLSDEPAACVQAARVLSVFDQLHSDEIAFLLASSNPEVRRCALRLFDGRLRKVPELEKFVLALADDPIEFVRIQAAFQLLQCRDPLTANVIAQTIMRSKLNSIEQYAALSSLNTTNALEVWKLVAASDRVADYDERYRALMRAAWEFGGPDAADSVLKSILKPETQQNLIVEFALLADWMQMASTAGEPDQLQRIAQKHSENLLAAVDTARAVMRDQSAAEKESLGALKLISANGDFGQFVGLPASTSDIELIESGLAAQRTPAIQSAALGCLARTANAERLDRILAKWEQLTPRLRAEFLDHLFARGEGLRILLDLLATGQLKPTDLNATQRERLLTHDDPEIRARAETSLAAKLTTNRTKLVDEWKNVFELTGEFQRGRQVFSKHCAGCHVLDGAGYEVGPDLVALTNRTPAALMVAVLDPNRDVDSRYLTYAALTGDGLTVSGLLASETGSSVTLKERDGKQHVLLRSDLEELRATTKSVMPEGIENDITQQDLADLIAYLTPQRMPRRTFAGNEPITVGANTEGALVLPASAAEVFGEQVIFETDSPYKNIGFWSGQLDHVCWSTEVSQKQSYDVYLDYACSPDSAGNSFLIWSHVNQIEGVAESTGAWSEYRWLKAGSLELPGGRSKLSMGFAGPKLASALLDLRQIVLMPAGTKPTFDFAEPTDSK